MPSCVHWRHACTGTPILATERLCSAGEEALLSLVHQEEDEADREGRHLLVVARNDHGTAELEFIAALGEDNLEDRMLILREQVDRPNERELSLRLLRTLRIVRPAPAVS